MSYNLSLFYWNNDNSEGSSEFNISKQLFEQSNFNEINLSKQELRILINNLKYALNTEQNVTLRLSERNK